MRRSLSLLAVVAAAVLLCGCHVIHSPFLGTWVCGQSVEDYPERIVFNADGFGTADGAECEWVNRKSQSELILQVESAGEFRYKYSFFNHSTLYLNNVVYHLEK